jgi:hypothetical protein
MFGGPVVLAALGIAVTELSPKGRARLVWFGAFILVSVVTISASVVDSLGTDERITQVWEQMTGGENYVVIKANESDMKARKDELRFEIGSTGPMPEVRYWIHPASTKGDANNPDYYKYRDKGGGIFQARGKVGGLMGIAFPIGSYRIEMDAANGHYVEHLNIFEFNGQIVQTIDVIKDGKTIYTSPRP